jgi:transcriptional regulator with XRE-family HTH domain
MCEMLKGIREERSMSQMALATKLKRAQTYVSKVERGERRIDVVEFLDLTRALGVDPFGILRRLDR